MSYLVVTERPQAFYPCIEDAEQATEHMSECIRLSSEIKLVNPWTVYAAGLNDIQLKCFVNEKHSRNFNNEIS